MEILSSVNVVTWIVILLLALITEAVSLGLTSIWFAGGALVSLILAIVGAPIWAQVAAFLVVTIALLFFTRPIAVRYFNKERYRSNIEGFIGREVIVMSEIDNLQGIGRVNVGGQEWSARTTENGVVLPVGTVAIVKAVSGVKLIVEEKK